MEDEAVEWNGWHRWQAGSAFFCAVTTAVAATLGGSIADLPLIPGHDGRARTRARSIAECTAAAAVTTCERMESAFAKVKDYDIWFRCHSLWRKLHSMVDDNNKLFIVVIYHWFTLLCFRGPGATNQHWCLGCPLLVLTLNFMRCACPRPPRPPQHFSTPE